MAVTDDPIVHRVGRAPQRRSSRSRLHEHGAAEAVAVAVAVDASTSGCTQELVYRPTLH